MVSKLSATSLALAVISALACDLSSGGQAVQDDFNNVIDSNNVLQGKISDWDTSSGLLGALPIATQSLTVLNYVKQVNEDLSALDPSDCDVETIISQLNESAPTITATLKSLTDRADDFASVGSTPVVVEQLNSLASATMDLITTTYGKLPCDVVGQTFDALDAITSGFAAAQEAYGQDVSAAPTQPETCGGTTPPPSTCSRKKRSN